VVDPNSFRLHLWVPCLYRSSGGIQAYSASVIQALQTSEPHLDCTILAKHDVNSMDAEAKSLKYPIYGTGSWPSKLRTVAYSAKLIGFALRQRPSLVFSTHLNFIPIAYWLKRIAGIPYWVVAHGIEAWDLKNPTLQRALQQADRILPVSHYTRDRLLAEQHLDPAKLSVLPNTFGADRFQIGPKPNHLMERYHLTAQQRVILTVSRLSSQEGYKGYDQIIRALPYIRQQVPDVHYLLVGKGDDRPRLEQLIATLKLQDCVTLAGFVPDNELCDHYNLCDVFAMPSQGEGFGIVYLEALACGKPTLGGNRDGAIDALCQGLLGALVNPDDVNEIAIALAQMLQQTYAHPLMYQPDLLREKVIEIYGFQRFTQTLGHYLEIFRP
jgi:glycosyltransferase involved in cell wall biosynthesis